MRLWSFEKYCAIVGLIVLGAILLFGYHNSKIMDERKRQCALHGGVAIDTGRALRDWLCLDKSALKELAK